MLSTLPSSPAMQRAERQIAHIAHAALKDRVRYALNNPEAQAVKVRYGARMAFLRGLSAASAVVRIEHWIALEQRSFQIACSLGRGNRLPLIVLGELRLIARVLRYVESASGSREDNEFAIASPSPFHLEQAI